MDRYSHIEFAKRLLKICGEDENVAYMSILPLVDGEPSFLHRLHCHPIFKSKSVIKAAEKVFGTDNGKPISKKDYQDVDDDFEYRRFESEQQQFYDIFDELIRDNTEKGLEVRSGYAPYLAVISHTYFDTFNNAVQAFTPYEPYCAGQYDMWKNINYFNYRISWYQEKAPSVREEVLNEEFWTDGFNVEELVKGMIHRLAHYTEPSIKQETLNEIEDYLGLKEVQVPNTVIELYENLEENLRNQLYKQTDKDSIKVKL